MYVSVCMYEYVCMHTCISECTQIHELLIMYEDILVCRQIYMNVYVYMCICMCESLYVCTCVARHEWVYECILACKYVCICDRRDTVVIQWAHWSHNLLPLHDSAPNGGDSYLSNSRFEGYRVMKHPAATQATQNYWMRTFKLTLDVYSWYKQMMNTSLHVYIPAPWQAPN